MWVCVNNKGRRVFLQKVSWTATQKWIYFTLYKSQTKPNMSSCFRLCVHSCERWWDMKAQKETMTKSSKKNAKKQKNRKTMSHPNQSRRPLLLFHPDNAPPSKVKTSPLTNPALLDRLIFADYPFKCHYPPNINPAWNREMTSLPKTTNTAIDTNQSNLYLSTSTWGRCCVSQTPHKSPASFKVQRRRKAATAY